MCLCFAVLLSFFLFYLIRIELEFRFGKLIKWEKEREEGLGSRREEIGDHHQFN